MQASSSTSRWLEVALGRCRYQAAVEATIIGLSLGLMDVHSTRDDWFSPELAYLAAGFVLGARQNRRAWQAWFPLTWSLYLVHRATITYGYRPPYVDQDANAALW